MIYCKEKLMAAYEKIQARFIPFACRGMVWYKRSHN